MKALKLYNLANGWFYLIYGLYGAIAAGAMARLMGWDPSLLGLHEIRALWMATAAAGAAMILYALKKADQKYLTLLLILVTLALASGRLLGLVLDGAGPQQTYYELGFEIFWAGLGYILYRRV